VFEFAHNAEIDVTALADLFVRAGWRENESAAKVEWAIAASAEWVTCHREGQLVGFGRIHKLDSLHKLVFDVVVDEEYRGLGLDDEIVRRLTAGASAVERIAVFRQENVDPGQDAIEYRAPQAPPDTYLG